MADIERAKQLIAEYCVREFGEDSKPDFSDLAKVPIAFTTTEDDEHEIQVYVDLIGCSLDTYVDGEPYGFEQYGSLAELNENVLEGMAFDELVAVEDEWKRVAEIIGEAVQRIMEEQGTARKELDREEEL